MATMRLQAMAMAHAWVCGHDMRPDDKGPAWFYVRAHDLGMKNTVVPQGRRIVVEIRVEDD